MAYLSTAAELAGFARARYVELAKSKTQLQTRQKTIREQLKKLRSQENEAHRKNLLSELDLIEPELNALPPKMEACYLWKIAGDCPHDLILAGKTLFAGGDDRVAAFDTTTGKMLWSAAVTGKAHGLAVANGRLLVSTDCGTIHSFGAVPSQ